MKYKAKNCHEINLELLELFTFDRGSVSSKNQWVHRQKKSQKLTPILQNLRFIAFLHYNFQKPVGARAPTAPTVTEPLYAY